MPYLVVYLDPEKEEEIKENIDTIKKIPKHTDNIVMVKLIRPKKLILPNRGTFYTRYKRVSKNVLSNNVTIKRPCKRGAKRKVQRGCGFGNILRKGFSFAKKIAKSRIEKDLAKLVIENDPTAY